jgi:hypothetical protein
LARVQILFKRKKTNNKKKKNKLLRGWWTFFLSNFFFYHFQYRDEEVCRNDSDTQLRRSTYYNINNLLRLYFRWKKKLKTRFGERSLSGARILHFRLTLVPYSWTRFVRPILAGSIFSSLSTQQVV